MTLRVVRPGVFTTVQDLGRPGFGASGVPPSGAMDPWALRAGNLLVGNGEGAAGLELTLTGPTVGFEADAVVALTGSEFERELEGREVPHATAVRVREGESLVLGRSREGARGYLAVRGGIAVAVVLGSRSTHAAAGLGGHQGRALAAGDLLPVGPASGDPPLRRLGPDALPAYRSEQALRAVPGPQEAAFTGGGRATFFSSPYRVSPRSDRIGIRLEGPAVERVAAADLLPEGLPAGAVQVPADGQPILLGNDRPTTGGYIKIATVISADLGPAAQAKPGDALRFVEVGVAEAHALWRERERMLHAGIEDLP